MTTAGRAALTWTALVALLVAGLVTSAAAGQLPIGPAQVAGTVLRQVGIANPWVPDGLLAQAVWEIRLPRAVMSALIGGALAVAGAVMQAIFANPLAEPGVVGVSSGAAVGAAIAIVGGFTFAGPLTLALCAFVGGMIATMIVYGTARSQGRTEVVTLVLTGVAINAFAGACLALLLFVADRGQREEIVFWQLGSLNASRWSEAAVVAGTAAISVVIALILGRAYDLLALGERAAGHLGVGVEALRLGSIVIVVLLTGVGIAFTGIIAFVGLVVPHAVRMLLGPAHRLLIATSLIGGAALLTWADLAARTLVAQADLPIGLLTALIGGPFFFVLIHQTRRRAGGWA